MIIKTIQNFIFPPAATRGCAAHLASAAPIVTGGGEGPWRRLQRFLVESSRRHHQLDQERRAIAHLHRMTDHELRDIGIQRDDIEDAVRHGRRQTQA